MTEKQNPSEDNDDNATASNNGAKKLVGLIALSLALGTVFLLYAQLGDTPNDPPKNGSTSENTFFLEPTNQSCTVRINSYTIPIRYHFNNATCQDGITAINQNGLTDYTVKTDQDNVTFTKNNTGIIIEKEVGEDTYLPIIKPRKDNETKTSKEQNV